MACRSEEGYYTKLSDYAIREVIIYGIDPDGT